MNTKEKLAYAVWVARQEGKQHEWGVNDCCTAFLDMMDTVYGTEQINRVRHQYTDKRSAYLFYKNMGITYRQYLAVQGFSQIENTSGSEGDIRVSNTLFPTVYMKHNGYWWTMDEGRGWTGYTPNAFTAIEYTQWRR